MMWHAWRDDEPKREPFINPMMWWMPMAPEETPENKSISTLNFIRTFFYRTIDELNKKINELQRFWLSEEVECLKDVMKDLWTQSEKLNEVLRNKYSDIKEAQDIARSSDGDSKEEAPKECPECWEPMDGDTCSECWYTFKS